MTRAQHDMQRGTDPLARAGRMSAVIYTSVSLAAALAFLLVTLLTGDYSWVARIGGAVWLFLLSMIILMPTVTPWVRTRVAGKKEQGPRTSEGAGSPHHVA